MTRHGFCSLHKIAYDRNLDAHCPQCTLGQVAGVAQLDYEPVEPEPTVTRGRVLDPGSGKLLNAITLQPAE